MLTMVQIQEQSKCVDIKLSNKSLPTVKPYMEFIYCKH